jgi:toluene monooxygenase system protein B
MSVALEPQPVPVNALFDGDFITHLVLIMSTDTVAEAAAKIAELVVGIRVEARDKPYLLSFEGKVVPADVTVAAAGITPLSEIFVGYAE